MWRYLKEAELDWDWRSVQIKPKVRDPAVSYSVAVMSAEKLIAHRPSWSLRLGRKSLLEMMAPRELCSPTRRPDGRTVLDEAGRGLSGQAIGPIARGMRENSESFLEAGRGG